MSETRYERGSFSALLKLSYEKQAHEVFTQMTQRGCLLERITVHHLLLMLRNGYTRMFEDYVKLAVKYRDRISCASLIHGQIREQVLTPDGHLEDDLIRDFEEYCIHSIHHDLDDAFKSWYLHGTRWIDSRTPYWDETSIVHALLSRNKLDLFKYAIETRKPRPCVAEIARKRGMFELVQTML